MRLKAIILGLAMSASALSAETLEEFVAKNGKLGPDRAFAGASSIVYTIILDTSYLNNNSDERGNRMKVIEIILTRDTSSKNYAYRREDAEPDYGTAIRIYRQRSNSTESLFVWSSGNKNYNPKNGLVLFEKKNPRSCKEPSTDEEAEEIFNQAYRLAESYCGLQTDNKEKINTLVKKPAKS